MSRVSIAYENHIAFVRLTRADKEAWIAGWKEGLAEAQAFSREPITGREPVASRLISILGTEKGSLLS